MVGGQMESCVQCVYRVYRVFTSPDMVHGRVSGLFTHEANIPRNEWGLSVLS